MMKSVGFYLGDEERSVGVPLPLLQGEPPRRAATQGHAEVIPCAHGAPSSSAEPPQDCQQNQQQQQHSPLHHHLHPLSSQREASLQTPRSGPACGGRVLHHSHQLQEKHNVNDWKQGKPRSEPI